MGAHGSGVHTLADVRKRCKVTKKSGCWIWQMGVVTTQAGLAVPRVSLDAETAQRLGLGRDTTARRAVWMLSGRGLLSRGWKVWSSCGVEGCCAPEHLVAGPVSDLMRGVCQRNRRPATVHQALRRGHALPQASVFTWGGR